MKLTVRFSSVLLMAVLLVFPAGCGKKNALTGYDYGKNIGKYVTVQKGYREIAVDDSSPEFRSFFDSYLCDALKESDVLTEDRSSEILQGDSVRYTVFSDAEPVPREKQSYAGSASDEFPEIALALVGKRPGEKTDVNLKRVDGTSVTLHVEIISVRKPVLSDDSAKQLGFRDENDLRKKKKPEAQKAYLLNTLKSFFGVKEYPEKELRDYTDKLTGEQEQIAAAQGKTPEQYYQLQGLTEAEFHDRITEQAKLRVDREIYLYAFARLEGWKISEKELKETAGILADAGGTDAADVLRTDRTLAETECIKERIYGYYGLKE